MYGMEWPFMCWCAVKKLLTHSPLVQHWSTCRLVSAPFLSIFALDFFTVLSPLSSALYIRFVDTYTFLWLLSAADKISSLELCWNRLPGTCLCLIAVQAITLGASTTIHASSLFLPVSSSLRMDVKSYSARQSRVPVFALEWDWGQRNEFACSLTYMQIHQVAHIS